MVRSVAEEFSERTEWARRLRLMRVPQWQRALQEHEGLLRGSEDGDPQRTAALLVRHSTVTVAAILGRDVSAEGEVASVIRMLNLDAPATTRLPAAGA